MSATPPAKATDAANRKVRFMMDPLRKSMFEHSSHLLTPLTDPNNAVRDLKAAI